MTFDRASSEAPACHEADSWRPRPMFMGAMMYKGDAMPCYQFSPTTAA